MTVSMINSGVTTRVKRHRQTTGLIRVEVEVPTRDDAAAVCRFAQARRRARENTRSLSDDVSPAAAPGGDLATILAGMDAERWAIVAQFARALGQTTDRDVLARGRRVALNFAAAVAQRCRDKALCPDDDS
jgi:hypothetical protein